MSWVDALRTRGFDPSDPRAPRRTPEPASLPPAVARVLALQRSTGNAQVTALVKQHAAANQLHRARVKWSTDAAPKITEIHLDRLPGSGGGAHTTSYQLFIEALQNNLMNSTYAKVIERMKAMEKDFEDLPGWDATNLTQQSYKLDFDNAVATAEGYLLQPANWALGIDDVAFSLLQLRNKLDYTKHDPTSGWGEVGANKEPGWLKELSRLHQQINWDTAGGAEIDSFAEASFQLIDMRKVKLRKKKSEHADDLETLTNIVVQHHAAVINAHPETEKKAKEIAEALVACVAGEVKLTVKELNAFTIAVKAAKGWQNVEATF